MKDETLLLLAGGGFLVWYLTRRPVVASATSPLPNIYGNAAGYVPPAGTNGDPSLASNWAGMLTQTITGLAGVGIGIANAVNGASSPATSSGSFSGSGISSGDSGSYGSYADYSSQEPSTFDSGGDYGVDSYSGGDIGW